MLIPNNLEAEKELKHELLEGEKLLWTGRPQKGIKFTLRDIFFIPFSIAWFGGALLWEFVVAVGFRFPTNMIIGAIGIPFVLLGLYITMGRFIYDSRRRANTFYGITQERVIIKSGVFKRAVEFFPIEMLVNMSLKEKADGRGTIRLDDDPPRGSVWRAGYKPRKVVWAIEYVYNVRSVYDLILKRQAQINNQRNFLIK